MVTNHDTVQDHMKHMHHTELTVVPGICRKGRPNAKLSIALRPLKEKNQMWDDDDDNCSKIRVNPP